MGWEQVKRVRGCYTLAEHTLKLDTEDWEHGPGHIFNAHADALETAEFGGQRLNACGYSLGALYPPTWMGWQMIYSDNPVALEANIVILMHMILLDWKGRLAISLGDTVVVTSNGCEMSTKIGTDLVVN